MWPSADEDTEVWRTWSPDRTESWGVACLDGQLCPSEPCHKEEEEEKEEEALAAIPGIWICGSHYESLYPQGVQKKPGTESSSEPKEAQGMSAPGLRDREPPTPKPLSVCGGKGPRPSAQLPRSA